MKTRYAAAVRGFLSLPIASLLSSRACRGISASIVCLLLLSAAPSVLRADGFSEADVLFYGTVHQVGGAHAVLLQAGQLEMTFVNPADAANRVRLTTELAPTGVGESKPYSYALRVPLLYLPNAAQKDSALSIGGQAINFRIEDILINGTPATLPDGSKEFFSLSFASRGAQYRLDLLFEGDSTDTDGDGLPDWWERLYGLDPNTSDADADGDDDGWNNGEEFARGSDPTRSNLDPQLTTTEVLIPESGEAGLLLQFLDSDTPAQQLAVTATVVESSGFEIKLDGNLVAPGTTLNLPLSDLEAGRVTVRHIDPALRSAMLPLAWTDGSTGTAGTVTLRVALPSVEDGSDASLWLDGNALGVPGSQVSSWPDRSGSARPAGQPLSEHQPTVVLEGNRRTADFGDAHAHLFFQDTALASGNQTLLAAYRTDSGSDQSQTLLASNRGFLELTPTTQAISYPGAPRYQIDGLAVQGYASALGTTTLSLFRREGGTLQNICGLSYDGEAVSSTSLEPVLPTLGVRRLALGGLDDSIQNPFNGRLHELLIFPRALGEQKLRDVHDYLQSKWRDTVIWDLSTTLKRVTVTATGPGRHIIRGGWGADALNGGALDDVLSGGPGDDSLTGGPGADRFVFGGVDTGNDVITDYDIAVDVIDLSALYWGVTGDARNYISVRLDTDFSTPIPTLNSALIVQRPGGGSQEILLRNVAMGATQLHQLIVEGRIQMGSLTVPTQVQLTLLPGGANPATLGEEMADRLSLEVTRSGDGVAGAMEVPLGFFEEALGRSLILEGASSKSGQRAVVTFAPGELSKTLTFRPVPDLETQGQKAWEVAVLPHYRYVVGGNPIQGVINDTPRVWMDVVETNILTSSGQAARIRLWRDGDLTASLSLDLAVGGTAHEGVHIEPIARQLLIPASAASIDLVVTPQPGWIADQARMVHVAIESRSRYQLGNPHSAVLYAADSSANANASGFERWLANATYGAVSSYGALVDLSGQTSAAAFLRAYATGLTTPEDESAGGLSLRHVNGLPEISVPIGLQTADLSWAIRASTNLETWVDVTDEFADTVEASRLKLLGSTAEAEHDVRFYRLVYNVTTQPSLGSGVEALTGGTRLGTEGTVSWTVDETSGALLCGAVPAGEVCRLIVEVDAPAVIACELAVEGGNGVGSLAFFVDGVRIAETTAAAVPVHHVLSGTGKVLLMWESTIEAGQAVIRSAP
ncbi:MAG: hypothetical protein HQ523_06805 [Lentisphaerae bacterium]|nr:hypothetical protein [Lentisphaerota bacterium]